MKNLVLMALLVSTPAAAQVVDQPPPPPETQTVCLRITGTRVEARDALRTLGFAREMLTRDESGAERLVGYNHRVAIDFWRRPLRKRATVDIDGNILTAAVIDSRPILRILFLTEAARRKARQAIIDAGGLPAGLERVTCPAIRRWF